MKRKEKIEMPSFIVFPGRMSESLAKKKKKNMTNKIGDPHTLPCKTAGAKVYGNRFKVINSIDRLFVNP